MHKLDITLKQHTPLIHFQHDQEGATLRASEVKPKLDKFILTKLGGDDYEKGLIYAKSEGWLIGIRPSDRIEKDYYALNYKLKFIITEEPEISDIERTNNRGRQVPFPLFFGNLNRNQNNINEYRKFSFLEKPFKATFLSLYEPILNLIQSYISIFLLYNNFGTRQSKGFGSFYLDSSEREKPYYHEPTSNMTFQLVANDYISVFDNIDLFYRSLRSGLNKKRRNNNNFDECGNPTMRDDFYFKSLLFMYGRHNNIQWEKKKIKKIFFLDSYIYVKNGRDYLAVGLEEQQKIRNTLANKDFYPLFYHHENTKLLKDLLGLSTNENWQSYDDIITKTEAAFVGGKYCKIINESDLSIARIKSPILFKIIRNGGMYKIFILIDDHMEKAINNSVLGRTFMISSSELERDFPLSFPTSFSIRDFLDYIFSGNNFNIATHVERRFQGTQEYRVLNDIYSQLKKNYQ